VYNDIVVEVAAAQSFIPTVDADNKIWTVDRRPRLTSNQRPK
jgi:hypothetical protein